MIGSNIIQLQSVDSTNLYARRLLSQTKPCEGTVIWTMEQTAGKGRGNNTWESLPGENLTFSIILYPDFLQADQQFFLSCCLSLGVLDFLRLYSEQSLIKWPNDLFIHEKKTGGILIENQIENNRLLNSVAGIGVNINQTRFPENLTNPVSLSMILGKELILQECLELLIRTLDFRYQQLKNHAFYQIKQEYLHSLYRYDDFFPYKVKGVRMNAKIIDVKDNGFLVLEKEHGETTEFNMDEIEYIL